MRFLGVPGLAAVLLTAFGHWVHAADEDADILCSDAPEGTVLPVPEPFDRWVTLLCAPDGQALAAELGEDGTIWVVHGAPEIFMVKAVPQGVADRESFAATHGRHQIRFVALSGMEHEGAVRKQLLGFYLGAFPDADINAIDAVFQLDAQSVYNMIVTHMFFFVANGQPQHVLVCTQSCTSMLPVDVTTLGEW